MSGLSRCKSPHLFIARTLHLQGSVLPFETLFYDFVRLRRIQRRGGIYSRNIVVIKHICAPSS